MASRTSGHGRGLRAIFGAAWCLVVAGSAAVEVGPPARADGIKALDSSAANRRKVYRAVVTVHPDRGAGRSVNRRVLGVCLMHPPFGDEGVLIRQCFAGTSVRIWAREAVDWWEKLAPGLRNIEPCRTLAFVDKSWHPEKVVYRNRDDNNLFPYQKPDAVVGRVRFALERLQRLGIEIDGPLYWEVWNEPQFDKNGGWPPEALARYANDCAGALKGAGLPVKVGVPLHMGDSEWNERLCKMLDPGLIDFLVNHYYNVGWHKLSRPRDEFLRRAGYGPVLRERVLRDRALVERFGRGKWTLHCSEWNVHPPTYKPPFHTSHDMAVALYVFSAVRVYLEERLSSAQFFLLSAPKKAHFSAMAKGRDAAPPELRPTGGAFRLLHRSLRGRLAAVDVQTPTFVRDGQLADLPSVDVPYLEAMACTDPQSRSATLLLANKDPERSVSVSVVGLRLPARCTAAVLTGESERGDAFRVEQVEYRVRNRTLSLPPASIVVLTFGRAAASGSPRPAHR
ncbi:MAG: hypothetical protein GXP31_07160 [Kiritimatiellaeota bacterium]|nr:hypothetical protein [Kiritimatiellota bacterium]